MCSMANTFGIFKYLLDFATVICVVEIITGFRLKNFILLLSNLDRYTWVLRVSFIWLILRLLFFFWRRYKLRKKLNRKVAYLSDQYDRLYNRYKCVQKHDKFISEDSELLTKSTLNELKLRLKCKQNTSLDLVEAFQQYGLKLIERKSGCISEIVYGADVYAILADSLTSHDRSELSGIPIGLEEIFPIQGYDHTMGYTSRTDRHADFNCKLVETLLQCGMIPVILTNSKQCVFSLTARNPIFGMARHPSHPDRVCVNGSAALLSHHGCPLVISVDSLGEARLSAVFCGKCAFKPTRWRLSDSDLQTPIEMPDALGVTPTPITHNIEDMVELFTCLWSEKVFTLDPTLAPIAFDKRKYLNSYNSRHLKVGYYHEFKGLINASPAVECVMHETIALLKSRGHDLIEFDPPSPHLLYQSVIRLLLNYMKPQIRKYIYQQAEGDILSEWKQRLQHMLYLIPDCILGPISVWLSVRIEQTNPIRAIILKAIANSKLDNELNEVIRLYKEEFFALWKEHNLDLMICPVSPIPAPRYDCTIDVTTSILLYTCLYNVMGCPAGVVPRGFVNKSDDGYESNASHNMFAEHLKNVEGLPIGVQVVGQPWNDEAVLGLLNQLNTI